MPNVRLIQVGKHGWGEGKTHAATWSDHLVWGWGWYPICTNDRVYGKVEHVRLRDLDNQVTCLRCRRRLEIQRRERVR